MQKLHTSRSTYFTFLLLLTCCLSFIFTKSVNAQGLISELTVSPPVAYIKIKPGSIARHTITIENNGDLPIRVTPRALDFTTDGKTGIPVLLNQSTFPYFDNYDAIFKTIAINPNQKAQLTLQFTVPQGSPEKEYPFTIVFNATTEGMNSDSSRAEIEAGIGSNLIILVSAKNELEESLTVTDFGFLPIVDSFSELALQPSVKNERFNATTASGSATLTNWLGQTVAEFDIHPDTILGFSSRSLRFMPINSGNSLEPPLPTVFLYDKNLLGPYTFTLSLSQEDNQPPTLVSKTFFALPFIVVAIGGFLLAVFISYNAYFKKKLRPEF